MADWPTRPAALDGVTALRNLDRGAVETRLDGLVERNRFTIAVVFPVTGAALLLASAWGWLPAPLAFNPALILVGVLVMRLPLVAGVAPLVTRRAAVLILGLTAYAYGIEYVGTTTGWPYGVFEYGVALGPMVAGVPLGLPVFFFPLVLNSYLLCLLLLGDAARSWWLRLPVVVITVVAVDLVLDPGAVALGFWSYSGPGPFYANLAWAGTRFHGVPVTNYLGWVLSATIAVGAFDFAFDREALLARLSGCPFMLDDMVSFVILWGTINAAFGNVAPVALAALLGAGLLVTDRFDVPTRPRWAS
jgi:putative membrane protein